MAATLQRLFGPVQVAAAATAYFTAQANTEIRKLTFNNPNGGVGYQVSVWVVPSGSGGATGANQMITTRQLQPLESWDVRQLIGHVLNTGDELFAQASTAGEVNAMMSGLVTS